jgi:hypothetical protein
LIAATVPRVTSVVVSFAPETMDAVASFEKVNTVLFAESYNGSLENMFINRLVPDTKVKGLVEGVKVVVYRARPLTIRSPPMYPV